MLVAVAAMVGCGRGPAPVVTVTPADALYDHPVVTTVTGLPAGRPVTLHLTSRSANGVEWSSSAVFDADSHGRISTAAAPASGDYTGADPMGLVETLSAGALGQSFVRPPSWTMTMRVRVGGKTRASATFTREFSPAAERITETAEQPATSGVFGTLYLPATPPQARRPAVVVFGGSEGGLSTTVQASTLAAHGYPALALAYFHAPGLPQTLERIRLEYFATAARLLARQSGADPRRIVLWGTSRGSEAALLTAAHYPDLIHGVVASVPGSEAFGGLPDGNVPAWTLGGRDVPTAPSSDFLSPRANSPAAIPVERIRGGMVLVCGGKDLVWDSCANAAAIRARLAERGSALRPTVLGYPDAGHFVGALIPYMPSTLSSGTTASGRVLPAGGSYQADQAARADAWPRLLTFLAGLHPSAPARRR